jgi:response regulator NasT
MPALDGLEVADILTREQIAPVLLITALPDDASIARACAAGVIGYIVKPWRAQNLRPAIELALYRHHTARDLAVYAATLEDQPAMRKVVEDQLATRKVVEAAQARLVARYQLDPHQALRRIAKLAMNRRLSMRQAAEAILLADDAPS